LRIPVTAVHIFFYTFNHTNNKNKTIIFQQQIAKLFQSLILYTICTNKSLHFQLLAICIFRYKQIPYCNDTFSANTSVLLLQL